jgi:hypothetical protein
MGHPVNETFAISAVVPFSPPRSGQTSALHGSADIRQVNALAHVLVRYPSLSHIDASSLVSDRGHKVINQAFSHPNRQVGQLVDIN